LEFVLREKSLFFLFCFTSFCRYAPDGSLVAAGSMDGALSVWDGGEAGKRLLRTDAHARAVRSVAFAPDSVTVATASDDGQLRLWDARHAALVHSFSGHRG
jgi:WD40 repeat protein